MGGVCEIHTRSPTSTFPKVTHYELTVIFLRRLRSRINIVGGTLHFAVFIGERLCGQGPMAAVQYCPILSNAGRANFECGVWTWTWGGGPVSGVGLPKIMKSKCPNHEVNNYKNHATSSYMNLVQGYITVPKQDTLASAGNKLTPLPLDREMGDTNCLTT